MYTRSRFLRVALGVALLAGTFPAPLVSRHAPERLTSSPVLAPPQRANGDFDGDGRVDAAVVQDNEGDRRISIRLSASSSVIQLEAPVTGVVEGDVDHDGDLDLVASTLSGDVVIWLNDGRGKFTRQPASTGPGLSSEPVLVQTAWPESMAIGVRVPFVHESVRAQVNVVVTNARPPSAAAAPGTHAPLLPALRAPPALPV